ncbi:MAG: low molecular weight phosphotyrosine protein phosphatase [Spirochaetales bacterium]|nr:low molecular weight phosphotyrosine protein phosphatase [Spirochaetales bacterium]
MKILFVCLGNICRSPLAHAVCEQQLQEKGLGSFIEVESAGVSSYHVGDQADSRMRKTAAGNGIRIDHRSRHFTHSDFSEYDLIFAMDRNNYSDMARMFRTETEREKVVMFRDFDPAGQGDVPDPYYGGPDGFQNVFDIVKRTCESIVVHLQKQL